MGLVVNTQERGAMALEREGKKVQGAEGVERVLDRLSDAMDDAADVLEAGNRKIGALSDMDDDDLLDELEQLELLDEMCATSVPEMCATSVPDEKRATQVADGTRSHPTPAPVPTETPAQIAERAQEERELAELTALSRSMLQVETPMPLPMMAACH